MLVKRSFTLSGHRTSVALEAEFWDALEALATSENRTLAACVAAIDAHRVPSQPLASSLRITALAHRPS